MFRGSPTMKPLSPPRNHSRAARWIAKGDIVLLTTELGRDDNSVQDQVVKLDAETSSVTRLLDFGSLFADYKASATHAGTDDSDELPVNLRAVAPAVRYNRRYGFLRFAVRR